MVVDGEPKIIWIGGPAAAGKTTVSRLFARKHGFLWYSLDAHLFDQEKRAAAAGLHVLGTGPGDFDRRPMIIDDLHDVTVAVVVEGAFVTPAMADGHAVWLMPSEEEQLARLRSRNPGEPLEGYLWGRQLIASQLEGTDATVITVDGQTPEQTLVAVEQTLRLNTFPAARTPEDRRSLIRISNRHLTTHATERNRATVILDCECADPTCTALITLPTQQATHLTNKPTAIITPTHHPSPDTPLA